MTIEGYGPYQIASKLKSEKVLIPSAYLAQHLSLIHISSDNLVVMILYSSRSCGKWSTKGRIVLP